MRRLSLVLAAAMLLAATVAAPAQAARHEFTRPIVTSITITATGGTWPYCTQSVTLSWWADPHDRSGLIWVIPNMEGASFAGAAVVRVRGSGSAEVAIPPGTDFSQSSATWQPEGWFWKIATSGRRAPAQTQAITTAYDFGGRCPVAGTVIAGGLQALPSWWL